MKDGENPHLILILKACLVVLSTKKFNFFKTIYFKIKNLIVNKPKKQKNNGLLAINNILSKNSFLISVLFPKKMDPLKKIFQSYVDKI